MSGMKIKVWIVAINHKHGTDLLAAASEGEANEKVATFAEEWWKDFFPDEDPPADRQELSRRYFEAENAAGGCEWAEIGSDLIELEEAR